MNSQNLTYPNQTSEPNELITGPQLVEATRKMINEISPQSLHQQQQDPHAQQNLLIDIREANEFAQGHIACGTLIPRGLLEFQIMQQLSILTQGAEQAPQELKTIEIILYCRSGGRSALAAKSLTDMGFTNVYSLAGGINAWQAAGYPIINKEAA